MRALLLLLLVPGCGIGVGRVALRGATDKHTSFSNYTNCRPYTRTVTVGNQTTYVQDSVCDTVPGSTENVTYNPGSFHTGLLFGLKEGYSWATVHGTAAMKPDIASSSIEPYFAGNLAFGRWGISIEGAYSHQGLDDMSGLSFGSFALSALGMVAVGPLTVFGGAGKLFSPGFSDNTSELDLDGGYRLEAGLKGRAFSIFSDKIDVYPRAEVVSMHASGAGQLAYDATALDFTLELGF